MAEFRAFGERLKRLRETAGLTQTELAAAVGKSTITISRLERGVQEPTWPLVLELCRPLGVNCLAFTDADGTPPGDGDAGPAPVPAPPAPAKAKRAATKKNAGGNGR